MALRRGYQSQEAAVHAAILGQFPAIDVELTGGGDTSNVITTGVGVSIDLPIFNQNQGQIAIERASRQKLYDEYVSRVFETRADVAALLQGIHAVDEQLAEAHAAIPPQQRLVDTYQTAVRAGQADVLSSYQAWADLARKHIAIIGLQQTLAELRIGLELATGLYNLDSGARNPAHQSGGTR